MPSSLQVDVEVARQGIRSPFGSSPDTTHVGRTRLAVSNLEASIDFYGRIIGLHQLASSACPEAHRVARFGTPNGKVLSAEPSGDSEPHGALPTIDEALSQPGTALDAQPTPKTLVAAESEDMHAAGGDGVSGAAATTRVTRKRARSDAIAYRRHSLSASTSGLLHRQGCECLSPPGASPAHW